MTLNKKNRRILRDLGREAEDAGLGIGAWLLGPNAGTFYVLDLQTRKILTGGSGMTLAELKTWFSEPDVTPPLPPRLEIGSRIAA